MRHRRLDATYAMQGIAFGLLMPFPVPLLSQRGLGAAEIGLILGITGLAALLAYPFWGVIADGWLGRPRTIALAAALAAVGGVWILVAGDDPAMLTAALSVAIVGALAWGPLIDALTLGILGAGSGEYGRVRVWASVGWAASAMAGGLLWAQAGPEPVFAAFVVAASALLVLALLPMGAQGGSGRPTATRPSLRSWLPFLLAPLMLGFLAGLLLTSIGEHASWRFISLRILDQGGGIIFVSLAAAIPALVEIPVFASSRGLAVRLGLRRMFVAGALVAAALMALVAVASEPWMITTLRSLEGASYALRYMAMVLIIGALMPSHLYAMGQAIAWFVYAGIAPIVGDALGGIVYEGLGAEMLFVFITALFTAGAGVVWLVLRGPQFGPRQRPAMPAEEVPVPPPPT